MGELKPGNKLESRFFRTASEPDAIVLLKKTELKISRIHTVLGVHVRYTCALVGNDDGIQRWREPDIP